MSPLDEHPALMKGLRTAQVILGALLLCIVAFAAILLWLYAEGRLPLGGQAEAPPPPQLTWGFGAAAVVEALVFLLLRGVMLARAGRRLRERASTLPRVHPDFAEAGEAGHLLSAWLGATIVAGTGLEGAALLCLVAFLLGAEPVLLLLAAVFAFGLALLLPSRRRLDDWLDRERVRLAASPEP